MPPAAKKAQPAKAQPTKTAPAAPTKADDKPDANAETNAQSAANLEAAELARQQQETEHRIAVEATENASMGRAEAKREADTKEERQLASRVCVVSDGSPHTGYALPGKKICSAHEIHYLPDGTPRRKVHAAAQKAAEKPDGGQLAPQP